jgi:hypothetical protein
MGSLSLITVDVYENSDRERRAFRRLIKPLAGFVHFNVLHRGKESLHFTLPCIDAHEQIRREGGLCPLGATPCRERMARGRETVGCPSTFHSDGYFRLVLVFGSIV